MKQCTRCKIYKQFNQFNKDSSKAFGLSSHCKSCRKELSANRLEKNREYINIKKREFYQKNKEELIAKKRDYYKNNLEAVKLANKIYYEKNRSKKLEYAKQYRNKQENKEASKEYRKNYRKNNREALQVLHRNWERQQLKTNPAYKLKKNLRGALRNRLHRFKVAKKTSALKYLPKDDLDLLKVIENTWTEGMTWDNHGEGPGTWQVDHIIPFAYFSDEEILKKEIQDILCHPLNLRAMWTKDNLAKSDTPPENVVELIEMIKNEIKKV